MNILIEIGKVTALLSFVIGTILLLIHLFFNYDEILIIGYLYTIIAILINSILFLVLLISTLINSQFRFELIKTCGIMLLNIPVVILYIYIVFALPTPLFNEF